MKKKRARLHCNRVRIYIALDESLLVVEVKRIIISCVDVNVPAVPFREEDRNAKISAFDEFRVPHFTSNSYNFDILRGEAEKVYGDFLGILFPIGVKCGTDASIFVNIAVRGVQFQAKAFDLDVLVAELGDGGFFFGLGVDGIDLVGGGLATGGDGDDGKDDDDDGQYVFFS